MISVTMRMQFWHSKLLGRNEFLKFIFRLWWVGTKQTQQLTLRARTVRAVVPWSLPHHPLGLPPWNSSRQGSSCREAFGGFLMAHPKRAFPWWTWLWFNPCSKQSWWLGLLMGDGERGLWVSGEWELRHLWAPQVMFVTGWSQLDMGCCPMGWQRRFGLCNWCLWWGEPGPDTGRVTQGRTHPRKRVQSPGIILCGMLLSRDKTHTNPAQSSCAAGDVLLCLESSSSSVSSPSIPHLAGKQERRNPTSCERFPPLSPPLLTSLGIPIWLLQALISWFLLLYSPLCRTRTRWSLCVPPSSGYSMVLWPLAFKSLCIFFLDPDLTSCCKATTCS